jgi:hypothetical protein
VNTTSAVSVAVLLATLMFMLTGYTAASTEYDRFLTTSDDITTVLRVFLKSQTQSVWCFSDVQQMADLVLHLWQNQIDFFFSGVPF